jgi:hypothetical protein
VVISLFVIVSYFPYFLEFRDSFLCLQALGKKF